MEFYFENFLHVICGISSETQKKLMSDKHAENILRAVQGGLGVRKMR